LGGPFDWSLDTVAQRMEQPVDVGGVVRNTKRAPNDLGHPLARPDLAAEAVGLRAAGKQGGDLVPLRSGEPGRWTRRGMAPQRLHTVLPRPFEPLTGGALCDAERGGNRGLFPALLLEILGASQLTFAPIEPWLALVAVHAASAPYVYLPIQTSVV
jgi:hypothetical protein